MTHSTTAMMRLSAGKLIHSSTTKGQPRASKRITVRQADNIMAALFFARQLGTPLNAHATIHWVGTEAGDDPDGRQFAKVREGFDKWLNRQGVPGGLTAIWVCASGFRGARQRWSIATCSFTSRTPLFEAGSGLKSRGH